MCVSLPSVRGKILAAGLVAATGCSKPWYTTSAAIMPNPVLLGPVERVHANGRPPPPPPAIHQLSDELGIVVDIWHQDVETQAYYNSTTTWTNTRTDAKTNLGLEILARLAPTESFIERYQKTDIVYIRAIRLETATIANRGFGHSDTHESFWLRLENPMLAHLGVAGGAANPPNDPPPPVTPPPSTGDLGEKRQ